MLYFRGIRFLEVFMNKKELIESVSKERNLTKKDAEILVDTVFNTITRSVVEGDKEMCIRDRY